jgi:hypothetical protein
MADACREPAHSTGEPPRNNRNKPNNNPGETLNGGGPQAPAFQRSSRPLLGRVHLVPLDQIEPPEPVDESDADG